MLEHLGFCTKLTTSLSVLHAPFSFESVITQLVPAWRQHESRRVCVGALFRQPAATELSFSPHSFIHSLLAGQHLPHSASRYFLGYIWLHFDFLKLNSVRDERGVGDRGRHPDGRWNGSQCLWTGRDAAEADRRKMNVHQSPLEGRETLGAS